LKVNNSVVEAREKKRVDVSLGPFDLLKSMVLDNTIIVDSCLFCGNFYNGPIEQMVHPWDSKITSTKRI